MRDLVSLDGENWCLNCLWEREKALKAGSEAGEDVLYKLERVRDAIWILERGRREKVMPEVELEFRGLEKCSLIVVKIHFES